MLKIFIRLFRPLHVLSAWDNVCRLLFLSIKCLQSVSVILLFPHASRQDMFCSAGTRFRLLLLALQHCRQTQQHQRYQHGTACPAHITVLFERILATALQAFSAPPTWFGKWQKTEAR